MAAINSASDPYLRTIGEAIKVLASIQPQTITVNNGDTSGETVIDTLGFDNVCFVIVAGNGTFVDETYSFQVYENAASNTTSGHTAITSAVAITATIR